MRWEYVDLENGMVLFPETKNQESRTIFLSTPVIEMLKDREPAEVGKHVFLTSKGKPYRYPPCSFKTAVKNLGLNEGYSELNKLCFHSLRHTAATHAGRKVPMKDLQVMFGWKTPEMVFRYCKGDQAIQRKAMADLAGTLAGKVTDISEGQDTKVEKAG
jgi:integrase